MMIGKIIRVLVETNYSKIHVVKLSFSGTVRSVITAKQKMLSVILQGAI
jgi:hypothetical protein